MEERKRPEMIDSKGDLYTMYDDMMMRESIATPRFFTDKGKTQVLVLQLPVPKRGKEHSWQRILNNVH